MKPTTMAIGGALLGLALSSAAMLVVMRDTKPGTGPERGASCPAPAARMLRLELVFGMGRKGRPEVSDEAWRQFLDAEVTSRFPDGLTVMTGYGQWRGTTGEIAKETSRLLLVWLKPGTETDSRIEAVRAAWKARHSQESVLRAESFDCVSF